MFLETEMSLLPIKEKEKMEPFLRFYVKVTSLVYIFSCICGVTFSLNVEEQFTALKPESPTITAVRGNGNWSLWFHGRCIDQ